MNRGSKRSLLVTCCAIFIVAGTAATEARAQDEDEVPDARLMGYKDEVKVGGGYAGSFAVLGVLTAITVGLLFKNSNRSHLD